MVKQIALSQGKFALVDDEDFEELNQYQWNYRPHRRTAYAQRQDSKDQTVYMHHHILEARNGLTVDHRDGNGLNNQRANLRYATYSQNQQNKRPDRNARSKYKGVWLNRKTQFWAAQITLHGKKRYLGSFTTQREAAIAYNNAASELFGEFARLNIIPDEPDPNDQPLRTKHQPASNYRGVDFHPATQKWRSRVTRNYKEIHLGLFNTQEEAAHAYDRYLRENNLKGKLNFPEG